MTRSLISISLMRFPLSLAHGGATYSVCSLPPCGQGNRIWVNKYESLTERTESKSSEIPVLFTHMRLPCPQGGGERTEFVARADSMSSQRALAWIDLDRDKRCFLVGLTGGRARSRMQMNREPSGRARGERHVRHRPGLHVLLDVVAVQVHGHRPIRAPAQLHDVS